MLLGKDSAEQPYCAEEYNRVLKRLRRARDEGVAATFDPLPQGSSLAIVVMECRQLAAYYEHEVVPEKARGSPPGKRGGRAI